MSVEQKPVYSEAIDPRAFANLLLDTADANERALTNLELQKLLYFAHGTHLTETTKPLVSGYFEAWQFGPVHPAVYRAFKSAAARPIDFRAHGQDPLTLATRPLAAPSDPEIIGLAARVVKTHIKTSAGRLVDISHATGGPWDFVVNKRRTSATFGHRISNDVIATLFRHHKVSVGLEPKHGEPEEDRPLDGNGFGARGGTSR